MQPRRLLSERIIFGILLSVAGGLMDSYSYLARGGVFATGQTGNFVCIAVRLAQGNGMKALNHVVPILFFFLGIFLSQHLHYIKGEVLNPRWKRTVLLVEVGVFLIVGAMPAAVPDMPVNAMISFGAAMQYCCFNKLEYNGTYATVFATGNLRFCAETMHRAIFYRDREAATKCLRYVMVLAAFFGGVVLGVMLEMKFKLRMAWFISLVLFICWLTLQVDAWKRKKAELAAGKEAV